MNRRLLQLHAAAAWLFLATLVVQVFLAGAAIRQLGGSDSFASHIDFGYTWVGLAAFAVVVTAIVARAGRRAILITLGLMALYIVQTLLPAARGSIPERNMDAWYAAFAVKPGDKAYLAPEQRVRIW